MKKFFSPNGPWFPPSAIASGSGSGSGSGLTAAMSPTIRLMAGPPGAVADQSGDAGQKNVAMTNAARAMPAATANPICCRIEFPARTSEANVPDRISPADPIAGPERLVLQVLRLDRLVTARQEAGLVARGRQRRRRRDDRHRDDDPHPDHRPRNPGLADPLGWVRAWSPATLSVRARLFAAALAAADRRACSGFAVTRLLRARLPGRLGFARVWGERRNPWKCGR